MKMYQSLCLFLLAASLLQAADYHVAPAGNDTNSGAKNAPFRTIQHAANLAQPGDVITVHAGVYRERVNPPRGGSSDAMRIIYQAAPGEKVVITGSEPVKGWVKEKNDTWKVAIPNEFFGCFNPYADLIGGEWYDTPKDKFNRHTGAVYLNEDWLTEAKTLDAVLLPPAEEALWFAEVDTENTTIRAQFKGVDPNRENVEINVRQSIFYPSEAGSNPFNAWAAKLQADGNVYLADAKPCSGEAGAVVSPEFNPDVKLTEGPIGEWWLEMAVDPAWLSAQTRPLVTTELLGKAAAISLSHA